MRIHNFKKFIDEAYDDHGTPLNRKWTEAQDELASLDHELKNLKQDLKQAFSDMENDPDIEPEGGKVADEWGAKLNDIEEEIAAKKKEIEELEAKIDKMENPAARKKKELTYEEAIHMETIKTINKNIDDIKKSRTTWPDRTIEQEAEIYKKRYGINGDIEGVLYALKKLQDEKKI